MIIEDIESGVHNSSEINNNSQNADDAAQSSGSDSNSKAEISQQIDSVYQQNKSKSTSQIRENHIINDKRSSFAEVKGTKVQLTWKNITITSMPKQRLCRKQDPESKEITILDDLSGTVQPGEYLAIIGASGAGKTTLLNYLSGKDPSKNLKKYGEVLLNNVNRDKVDFKRFVAYVQQDDVLIQTMTVRECLMFAAQLKLPPTVDHKSKVDALIESLKLERAANMLIGGSLISGIIGGERKCTSIGVELITDPSLIFLDEPTTGLDSFTATTIVEVMADLAKSGRTVISTIHQPNSEIFEKFDKLMLMAQGHTIYLNKAHLAVEYFSSVGYSCPHQTNPADYFMEIMSIETNEIDADNNEMLVKRKSQMEVDYKKKIDQLHNYYQNSELKCDADYIDPEANSFDFKSKIYNYRPPFFKQFCYLLQRDLKGIYRNPHASRVQIISIIIIAIMIILIYGKLGNNEQSIQSRTGVIMLNLMFMMFQTATKVSVLFPEDSPVLMREQGSGMYNVLAYFIAKVISEFPMMIIFATLFDLMTYFALGLNTVNASHFFIYYALGILFILSSIGLGLTVGAVASKSSDAVDLLSLAMLPLMLVCGFFVSTDQMVPVMKPFEYISIFKYGLQAGVINEYDGIYLTCRPSCDPVNDMKIKESLGVNFIAMGCLTFGSFLIAFTILWLRTRKSV